MNFGAEEIQPGLKFRAFDRARCRCEACGRLLICNVLHDCRAFGHALAVVEFEQRHIAVGVDLEVIATVFQGVGFNVHFHKVDRNTRFAQADMGR